MDQEIGQALRDALRAVDLAFTEPARARRQAEAARDSAGAPDEVVSVAEHALGLVYTAKGKLPQADQHLRRAVTVAERADLARRAAQARGSRGYVLTLSGRTAEGLAEID